MLGTDLLIEKNVIYLKRLTIVCEMQDVIELVKMCPLNEYSDNFQALSLTAWMYVNSTACHGCKMTLIEL